MFKTSEATKAIHGLISMDGWVYLSKPTILEPSVRAIEVVVKRAPNKLTYPVQYAAKRR